MTTTYPKSVINFATERGYHPTQKPVKLIEYMLATYVEPGAKVLDMFMGSGSTGAACKKFGAEFTGIERDQGFFDVATKRIQEAF